MTSPAHAQQHRTRDGWHRAGTGDPVGPANAAKLVGSGHLTYQHTDRLVVLTRTEVEAGFDDAGVSDALVRKALDDLRTEGSRRVVALCHYVAWWIGRHPDYASLVYDAADD